MKMKSSFLLAVVLVTGCQHEPPGPTTDFPMMPFRFIGSLHSISTNSYLNVHGEEWGMGITIERMLEGSYKDTNILWIGIDDPTNAPLEKGIHYDVRAAWGRHGMMLLQVNPLKDEAHSKEPKATP